MAGMPNISKVLARVFVPDLPSGLECLPGRYANAAELAALCVPLAGAELTVLADGALTPEGRDAGRVLWP